ncbi:MAG: hypothetical protein PHU17_01110 [Candidatus Pacebacteria bacterium]|nr:hypothetical protein [Candidatus Paceibacterota bacterium]MDD4074115.1 hypothetical protein [Candidatus Paceibacterota bacterium]
MYNKKIFFVIPAIILFFCFSLALIANSKVELTEDNQIEELSMSFDKEESEKNLVKVIITAYSSTVDQTDDTPFITASGSQVRDGIVANNMLPFGTEIKIPEYFGDKVFIVEDRMHTRKGSYWVDVWFSSTEEAKEFGIKEAYIEVSEI